MTYIDRVGKGAREAHVSPRESDPRYRLDEIDRRIIYELMRDARANSAPKIAEQVGVAPGTIRNRIDRLEEDDIVAGYHATVDFERMDGRFTTLFMCNVAFPDRETVAQQAHRIPGVVNIRTLMGGRRNLHVLAVGEDTTDLRRIGTALSELDIDIEDEMLVEADEHEPYAPFGPDDGAERRRPDDSIRLAGDSEVTEVTVRTDATVAGMTISQAVERRLINGESLVIAIERDEAVLTPHGNTTIEPDDIVTVFSPEGINDETIAAFLDPAE